MPRKRIPSNNECYSKPFPSNLRKLMEETSTTQQVLADALGVQRQTISYYCDGSSSPNWEGIANISKFFSVSADWLLGLSNVRSTQADMKSVCDFTGLSEGSVNSIIRETASTDTRLALEVILSGDNEKLHNLLVTSFRVLDGYLPDSRISGIAEYINEKMMQTEEGILTAEILNRWYGVFLDPKEAMRVNSEKAGQIMSELLENSEEVAIQKYNDISDQIALPLDSATIGVE